MTTYRATFSDVSKTCNSKREFSHAYCVTRISPKNGVVQTIVGFAPNKDKATARMKAELNSAVKDGFTESKAELVEVEVI
jgi:hypothetical protein